MSSPSLFRKYWPDGIGRYRWFQGEKKRGLEKISSSLHLDWWDIGPCMISKAYRNNKSSACILNNSEMDGLGFNAVTWKVNLGLPTILSNYPGYNKSQWYGSPSRLAKKAKRMMLNENFFYLPIWSIHKRNNGKTDYDLIIASQLTE